MLSSATALCKQGAVGIVFCCLLLYEFLVFRFFHMIQQDLICSDYMSFDIMVLITISQTKKHEKEQGLNFAKRATELFVFQHFLLWWVVTYLHAFDWNLAFSHCCKKPRISKPSFSVCGPSMELFT